MLIKFKIPSVTRQSTVGGFLHWRNIRENSRNSVCRAKHRASSCVKTLMCGVSRAYPQIVIGSPAPHASTIAARCMKKKSSQPRMDVFAPLCAKAVHREYARARARARGDDRLRLYACRHKA